MISVEAYKTSIGMFYSRLRVLEKSKSFKALSSSTSRVKRKWEMFFSFSLVFLSFWKVLKVIQDQVDLVFVQIILIQLGVIIHQV